MQSREGVDADQIYEMIDNNLYDQMDYDQLTNAYIFLLEDKYAWVDLKFEIESQVLFLTEVAKIYDPTSKVIKFDDLVPPRDDFSISEFNYESFTHKMLKDIENEIK